MKKRPRTMRGSDAPVKKFWPSKAPRTKRGSYMKVALEGAWKRHSKAPAPEDSVPLTPWARARLAYDDAVEGPQADFDANEAEAEQHFRDLIEPADDFAPSSWGSPDMTIPEYDSDVDRMIMDAGEQARIAGQGVPPRVACPQEGEGEGEQPPEGEGAGQQPPEGEG